MPAPRALIVDQGAYRSSLAAARALSAAGWVVGAASPGAGLAGSSRAATNRHQIASLAEGEDAFIESLARVAGTYAIVLPGDEASMFAVSARRGELDAVFPYAPHDTVLRCADKLELVRAAERVGIAVPRTVVPGEDTLPPGPVIVKPRHSARAQAIRAETPELAEARLAELAADDEPAVLQEVIDGRLDAISVVADASGRIVAAAQQESIRTWPPKIGVFASAVTVPVDEGLVERLEALFSSLGFWGFANVQFLTPADGIPRLIDLNGRFYLSLALAFAAGVNLPAAWADVALDRPVSKSTRARPGVRYQWFPGDIRAAGLRTALGTAPRSVHTLLDPRDPWPLVHYATLRLRERVRRSRRSEAGV